ncbi:MAG: hypothetical protein AB8I80_05435 [Anaerolineae bacterium]
MSEQPVNLGPNGRLLKPSRDVGIVGYGAYLPRYRLPAKEVSRIWTDSTGGTPIIEKSVPGLDEDVATMSIVIRTYPEACMTAQLALLSRPPRTLRSLGRVSVTI